MRQLLTDAAVRSLDIISLLIGVSRARMSGMQSCSGRGMCHADLQRKSKRTSRSFHVSIYQPLLVLSICSMLAWTTEQADDERNTEREKFWQFMD